MGTTNDSESGLSEEEHDRERLKLAVNTMARMVNTCASHEIIATTIAGLIHVQLVAQEVQQRRARVTRDGKHTLHELSRDILAKIREPEPGQGG